MLRLNGCRLAEREGKEVRVLLAIEDITEERRLQEKLRDRARELERSNADLEEFIEYAVDGAKRMKSLINSLLQYSRVGRKEGEFREVELGTLVDDITDDLERQIEETGAEVTRAPLPSVYGSANQLRRLFQNLIENALTYHSGEPPRIRVTSPEEEGGARVTVTDEGPGIPPEGQDKIFRIFKQLDPHGSGQEGSGMGLAICRKIAERHDGTIWVESEPGEGSTFHVTLHLTPNPTP